MDLFSKKADFEEVIKNKEAMMYHIMKYEMGFRYSLSLACYQYDRIQKEKSAENNQS